MKPDSHRAARAQLLLPQQSSKHSTPQNTVVLLKQELAQGLRGRLWPAGALPTLLPSSRAFFQGIQQWK